MNARTGHRSSSQRIAAGARTSCRRDWHRFQASFRRAAHLHLPEIGVQAIQLSPYHADLPARHPIRLGVSCRFSGMLLFPSLFRFRSAIRSRDISSHLCPLRGRYNAAPRGAAEPESNDRGVDAGRETGNRQCSNRANAPGGSRASRPAPQARQRAEERKRRGSRFDQLHPMQRFGM